MDEKIESRKCSFRIAGPPKESLGELQKCTKFSKRQIQVMYRTFKQDCPSGLLQEETFRDIFMRFFPYGNVNQYAHYVFKTFNQNRNEAISFKDFLQWLSLLCHGSADEKLKWAFRLYDINNDGYITRKELSEILCAIYALIGRRTYPLIDERTLSDHCDRTFQKLDANRDGVVTFEEFMAICAQDEAIARSLAILDTVI
ncbi:Kv channel-interacting protein 4-like [Oppia nitens]|uniref:Kv channel-interacting protein 4-like n=1 Tax=Oppia nitens TaxID=1686743 RepID=UPI0023DBFE43|nr:Kv channel-interacting protein 4-like [Oppia nitens]